jgi:hypothetical protein
MPLKILRHSFLEEFYLFKYFDSEIKLPQLLFFWCQEIYGFSIRYLSTNNWCGIFTKELKNFEIHLFNITTIDLLIQKYRVEVKFLEDSQTFNLTKTPMQIFLCLKSLDQFKQNSCEMYVAVTNLCNHIHVTNN